MRRFYSLVKRRYKEPFDPSRAAELEVEWWRVHREHQHSEGSARDPLVQALSGPR